MSLEQFKQPDPAPTPFEAIRSLKTEVGKLFLDILDQVTETIEKESGKIKAGQMQKAIIEKFYRDAMNHRPPISFEVAIKTLEQSMKHDP